MDKANQLWQEECRKKLKQRIDDLMQDLDISYAEAEEMALSEQEAEDEANGQFGVGA